MKGKQSITVVVVDDNPATLYSTSRILRSAGFEVAEAATGRRGIELAKNAQIVVLDVNLPDVDGFEVCRQIRANQSTARIPVIHLSATFVKDVDKVHGLEVGADGYLTHPVEPPVLIATVNAFLRTRQAEEELRDSEAKFRAVFDNAVSGIALVSKDWIFQDVNPAMCQLMGRSRELLLDGQDASLMPTAILEKSSEIRQKLAGGSSWKGAFPLDRPQQEAVHLEWSMSRYSEPDVYLAIVTDVTERFHAEEERRQLLASERAARSEAERANRMKDDFLATLSHELRTPLSAIVGWSQVLQRGDPTPEELIEGLAAIDRNAKAQTQLIADLLDVSRISSGKLRLEIEAIDPAKMIESALNAVHQAAEAKNISVDLSIDPEAGPVRGDPARLQQVIWNLMTNAVKFTPKGGRIHIELQRINSNVRITVRDNGEGISADLLPNLFKRFQQGDASTTRRHGGLGLGLAIVKHLVEMHGGTVVAASEGEGKGATFTVELPVAAIQTRSAAPLAAGSLSTSSTSPVFSTNLNGIKVLVVDDDPDTRALFRRVLSDCGAEVADAEGVKQALGKLDEFKPNVLVSDIGMPALDGYDLIREVRSRGYTFQRLPAVALTAFARIEDRRRAMLAGFQVHVSKPVDPSELTAVIATLVGRTG
ncbi:MAG TPA: response regulator [Pirellulales bacterium]|nr:response regulator [Pirellulales bacterium]